MYQFTQYFDFFTENDDIFDIETLEGIINIESHIELSRNKFSDLAVEFVKYYYSKLTGLAIVGAVYEFDKRIIDQNSVMLSFKRGFLSNVYYLLKFWIVKSDYLTNSIKPLLVYESIPNLTLDDLIYENNNISLSLLIRYNVDRNVFSEYIKYNQEQYKEFNIINYFEALCTALEQDDYYSWVECIIRPYFNKYNVFDFKVSDYNSNAQEFFKYVLRKQDMNLFELVFNTYRVLSIDVEELSLRIPSYLLFEPMSNEIFKWFIRDPRIEYYPCSHRHIRSLIRKEELSRLEDILIRIKYLGHRQFTEHLKHYFDNEADRTIKFKFLQIVDHLNLNINIDIAFNVYK